jgi:hypothetical protein
VSSVVHLLLYILLLAMPIVAWIGMSYAGMATPFFGLIELPPLAFTKNEQLSEQIFAVHRWVGYLLALVGGPHHRCYVPPADTQGLRNATDAAARPGRELAHGLAGVSERLDVRELCERHAVVASDRY